MLAFDLSIVECCFLTVQVHHNLVHDGHEYFLVHDGHEYFLVRDGHEYFLVTLMMLYLFAPCYSPSTHLQNQNVLLCSTKPLAERAALY